MHINKAKWTQWVIYTYVYVCVHINIHVTNKEEILIGGGRWAGGSTGIMGMQRSCMKPSKYE